MMVGTILERSSEIAVTPLRSARLFPFRLLNRILLLMSESRQRPDFLRRWDAFVDAYTHAVDLAPPCRRHLFVAHDLQALWADFLRTQMDFAQAEELILSDADSHPKPSQVAHGSGVGDDER